MCKSTSSYSPHITVPPDIRYFDDYNDIIRELFQIWYLKLKMDATAYDRKLSMLVQVFAQLRFNGTSLKNDILKILATLFTVYFKFRIWIW